MPNPAVDLKEATAPVGGVRLYWLGQAEFAFLTPAGRRIFLDPDAIPIIARHNPSCRFAGPVGCVPGLTDAGDQWSRDADRCRP